jgi:hypothetical protein
MQIVKAGVLYFALVFGAGFVLGTIRTLWVVPRFGKTIAELMETPIMLVVTIVAARWIVHRLAVPSVPSSRLGMGFIALGLMLVAEFGLVLWLRGLPIRELSRQPRPCVGNGLLRDAASGRFVFEVLPHVDLGAALLEVNFVHQCSHEVNASTMAALDILGCSGIGNVSGIKPLSFVSDNDGHAASESNLTTNNDSFFGIRLVAVQHRIGYGFPKGDLNIDLFSHYTIALLN